MNKFSTSQEILLVTDSKFASREYNEKEADAQQPKRPAKEKLADACWNGMLPQLLPEISISKRNRPLPLWEIGEGERLFYLKLGEEDELPEAVFTINPYRFLMQLPMN